MKILINTPHTQLLGGVANHYKGLKKYWDEDINYNFIGGRYNIPGSIILAFDLVKFFLKLLCLKPNIVLLNPSLGKTALKRDALFLGIATLFGFKTIVFIHGWDENEAKIIQENPTSFVKKFNKADAFFVLASAFKKKLVEWGIDKPIYLTTTKVDDSLIAAFDGSDKNYGKRVLFLARVIKEKGIFTTLGAFQEIKKDYPDASLTVAGDGKALDDAKDFVNDNSISNVNFTGFISGKKLKRVFVNSDLYLFPTEHGEGMPTSVLEAMAFGLPVISRPVGGIVDFFEEGKMGYLIESTDPDDYAEKVNELFENEEKLETIGSYNHNYARHNFLASEVAQNLEEIFEEIMIE